MATLLFDRDRFAFRFRYPDTLTLTEDVSFARSAGSGRGTQHVALALDPDNLVIVSRRELALDTTAVSFETLQVETDAVIAQLATDVPAGTPVTLDGLRGLEYPFDLDDSPVHHWYLVLFDHALQYSINCQSDAGRRAEITAAGELIRATFEHRPL